MGTLDGRVAIITGAGRGIGREHALLFAAEGAKVVVNDLGGDIGGQGTDLTPAQETVALIKEAGGEAVVNGDDVADWKGAQRLINQAVEEFSGLDVLVNNAGILRDRMLVNMTDEEFDAVIRVHLRGHFCPTRHAAAYWRAETKAGRQPNASIIGTSSEALFGNPGQTNYSAAKSGIATMMIVASRELSRYGVRANAITPRARTRLTLQTPGIGETLATELPEEQFDPWDPANISPWVAYLATADCALTGEVWMVFGDQVQRIKPWEMDPEALLSNKGARWEVASLAEQAKTLPRTQSNDPFAAIRDNM